MRGPGVLQCSLTPQSLVLTPKGFPGINQGEEMGPRKMGLLASTWPSGLSSGGSTFQAERYLDMHPLKQLRSLDRLRKAALPSKQSSVISFLKQITQPPLAKSASPFLLGQAPHSIQFIVSKWKSKVYLKSPHFCLLKFLGRARLS